MPRQLYKFIFQRPIPGGQSLEKGGCFSVGERHRPAGENGRVENGHFSVLGGANPAVNTPRPSRGTRIESCDFIVLIGDP